MVGFNSLLGIINFRALRLLRRRVLMLASRNSSTAAMVGEGSGLENESLEWI